MRRKGLHEIFEHRTQSPHDLDAARSTMTDLGASEVHKILPVRRPENEPQFARLIAELLAADEPQADPPKETMKLVNGKHGRCRIIDGRRQCFNRNIDQDAQGKGRILIDSTLGPKRNCCPQLTVLDGARAAIQPQQWFIRRHKVAHLGDELYYAVGVSRQVH